LLKSICRDWLAERMKTRRQAELAARESQIVLTAVDYAATAFAFRLFIQPNVPG
jgi:hypothetical protein